MPRPAQARLPAVRSLLAVMLSLAAAPSRLSVYRILSYPKNAVSARKEATKPKQSIATSPCACKGRPNGLLTGLVKEEPAVQSNALRCSFFFSLCPGLFREAVGAMTPHDLTASTGPVAPARYLPALFVLFVGSGCAALIYEVVWLQLLQLVIGSTAVSLGVLLGTFMGGMCAGSLLLPRLVSARWHPLRVYALLELGIGAIGLAVLFGMPHVEEVYTRYAGHGLPGILLRGAVAGVCLLPPTLLMGATLPAIARWVESGPHGVSWLGFFYGGNIAGAVFGCLLAGFYLLRVYDTATATYVAVTLNSVVAMVALVLAAVGARYEVPADHAMIGPVRPRAGAWAVHLAIALSGMSALGAEVVWTRLLSLMMGGTVYTFSLILAAFLIGLGIGSSFGAFLARRAVSAQGALGACQWLLTAAIAWTAAMISESLPYWPIVPEVSSSPWFTFQLDLVRCLWAILPPACLWGASFPLALAAVASRGQDAGRLVGGVYAANTVGAIAGALVFSLWLVPAIGTARAERVLIALAAAAALVAFLPLLWRGRADGAPGGAMALDSRPRSGRLADLDRQAGAVGACGVRPRDAQLALAVGTRHRQGDSRRAQRPGCLLHLRRRGNERIRRRHLDERRRGAVSTAPARCRHRPRSPTCGSSACWGTFRHLCTRSPNRCSSSPAAPASPPAPLCCTPMSSGSSSATSSPWYRPP